ncbi:hypothetical protein BpHYR1_051613 [Brachionus plicatilis]|uniref:Uncharacterized protein n=1 Tax=Brachionus plicatilis TaxID=10195 RepID=A0A3M7R0C0_BRAPC|nr:hypothetical protein BpHYR1_051613 [Brachionus plicatilis]
MCSVMILMLNSRIKTFQAELMRSNYKVMFYKKLIHINKTNSSTESHTKTIFINLRPFISFDLLNRNIYNYYTLYLNFIYDICCNLTWLNFENIFNLSIT